MNHSCTSRCPSLSVFIYITTNIISSNAVKNGSTGLENPASA